MKVDLTAAASEAGAANQQSAVQIFISYRRDDAAPDAGRLNEALSDYFGSEQVFTDVDDILPGARFGGDIRAAIDGSVALIALIGPRWVNAAGSNGRRLDAPDDYVRVEIRHAITQGKALLPVLVHGTRMPRHDELPGDIASLTTYSALDLTDSHWRADVTRLIDALVRVGAPVPPVTAFPGEQPQGRAERRDAWLVSGDQNAVRGRLEEFSRAHRMVPEAWESDTQLLRGGSKSSKLLGGFFVSELKLPTMARIRLGERGTKTAVEALIWEDWGFGVFQMGMRQRYEAWFETWMRDLRQATGA